MILYISKIQDPFSSLTVIVLRWSYNCDARKTLASWVLPPFKALIVLILISKSHTNRTFREWYNFLFIYKCSRSWFGRTIATCVPSITPITPGNWYVAQNFSLICCLLSSEIGNCTHRSIRRCNALAVRRIAPLTDAWLIDVSSLSPTRFWYEPLAKKLRAASTCTFAEIHFQG